MTNIGPRSEVPCWEGVQRIGWGESKHSYIEFIVKDMAFVSGAGFMGSYHLIKNKINITINHVKLLIINLFSSSL